MTQKDPKGKGPTELGPEQEAEILRRMDTVRFPQPLQPQITTESTLREVRFVRRVVRWADSHTMEEVAERLAWALIEKRAWERDAMGRCDLQAREAATVQIRQSRNRRGKGYAFWPAVREEWRAWQRHPQRYDGLKHFAAAMEAKYPGVTYGTLSNKITTWKADPNSHIRDS